MPSIFSVEEGRAGSPKLLSIGLHDRLIGRPARAVGLIKLLQHMRAVDGAHGSAGESILHATGANISRTRTSRDQEHDMTQPARCASTPSDWGYFDATLKPVLRIASGDTVIIASVSGGKATSCRPQISARCCHLILDILDAVQPELGPHILTGPVAVEGAEPGDVLEVRIEEVELIQDWGFNYNKPGKGRVAAADFPSGDSIKSLSTSNAMSPSARGRRIAARPILRDYGGCACAELRTRVDDRAARIWRQHRQSGTDGRIAPLSAGLRARRIVLGRRWAWLPG